MRILFFTLIILAVESPCFPDTATDISTFFRGHQDMFEEIQKRYNDKNDYKVKTMPGQKYASARPSRSTRSTHKSSVTASGAGSDVPPPDRPVTFSSKSAWADLTAVVENFHTHYTIKVTSTSPAEKWFIEKDDSAHTVISSGGLNDQYNFMIDQPGNFVAGQLNLRVINISDGNQYPSLFPLK